MPGFQFHHTLTFIWCAFLFSLSIISYTYFHMHRDQCSKAVRRCLSIMLKLRVGTVSSFAVSSGSRICTTYYFFPLVYILQICSEVEQRAHIALCHCFPGYSAKIDCGNNATCKSYAFPLPPRLCQHNTLWLNSPYP